MLASTYNKYKDKVNELYGEGAEIQIKESIAKEEYEDYENDQILDDDEALFFDFNSRQYFVSTINDVLQKTVMDDGLECYIISTPYDVPSSYYGNM